MISKMAERKAVFFAKDAAWFEVLEEREAALQRYRSYSKLKLHDSAVFWWEYQKALGHILEEAAV